MARNMREFHVFLCAWGLWCNVSF